MSTTATAPKQSTKANSGASVVLRAEGLRKAFGGHEVLKGIDLSLHKGEVVLLRGENGSGKTTLLNILTGNLEPNAGSIHYTADDTPRSYHFPRGWWQDLNPWDHFRPEFVAQEGFGRTWQDIRLFPTQTLRENIVTACPKNRGENPVFAMLGGQKLKQQETEIAERADALLARFGLNEREESSADRVSLGQSKRVAIARAIEAGAEVLLLDEPLAGLDGPGIRDVLGYLEELVRDKSLTLVIVEHVFNHPHLHGLVTAEWFLDKGNIQKTEATGHKSEVSSDRRVCSSLSEGGSDMTGRTANRNSQRPVADHQQSAISHQPSTTRPAWFSLLAGEDAEIIDEALPRGATLTRIRRPDRWKSGASPILEIKDLIVRRGPRTVLGLDDEGNETGFNLKIYEGEIILLQAPNGWGKTTLFDTISGQIPVLLPIPKEEQNKEPNRKKSFGCLKLDNETLNGIPTWTRAQRGLHMLPSDNFEFGSLSLAETYTLTNTTRKIENSTISNSRKHSSLSGGQLKRFALDKFFQTERKPLAVTDEVFSALDARSSKASIQKLLTSLCTSSLILAPKKTQSNKKNIAMMDREILS